MPASYRDVCLPEIGSGPPETTWVFFCFVVLFFFIIIIIILFLFFICFWVWVCFVACCFFFSPEKQKCRFALEQFLLQIKGGD